MLKHGTHHDHAKSVTAFLIVLVAFSIFLIFVAYRDQIMNSDNFPLFMTLATVGSALLLGLLYLVNNSKHKIHKAHKTVSKGGKVQKKKKK